MSDIAIASVWSCVTTSADKSEPHDELAQPRPRFLAQLRVEVRQRLVHQHDRRVVDERARDRDALLLAARELMRQPLRERAEAEIGERLR